MSEMPELSTDFRNRCEMIAVEERRKLGLKGYDPLSGEVLAEAHNVKIITPDELTAVATEVQEAFLAQRKIWGFLLQGDGLPPLILIHPNQPPTRRQSTLMHEIAHYLLGHKGDDLVSVLNGTSRDQQQEMEATYLGGCLQIPRMGLKWASQVGLSLERTRSRFNASEHVVRYRCNMTGIRL